MATSHTVEFATPYAADRSRATPAPKARLAAAPAAPRNRFVKLSLDIVDVFREARELEIRMLGEDRFRRIGEA